MIAIGRAWPEAGSEHRWLARDDFLRVIAKLIDHVGKKERTETKGFDGSGVSA